jgi:NAD(P)-dependent dehydrogenase (short-subunit alcohol dehydrogenase family)
MQDGPAARVVIVTGASTETGRAMAIAFGELGDAVVVAYHVDQAGAKETCTAVRDAGGQALMVQADVGLTPQADSLVELAVRSFGRVDVMCCHAGESASSSFLEYPDDLLDRLIASNIRGAFVSARAAARQMVAQGQGGRILLTSSITGVLGFDRATAYATTRAAIPGLTRSLAVELGRHGITVNAIVPGPILNARNLREDPRYAERWAALLPVGRVGQPRDVAAMAVFLASEEASFVTGASFPVDGGLGAIAVRPDLVAGALGET